MYQRTLSARILLSVGIGLLIFSLVFGWVSFAVPDWLQFYERNGLKSTNISDDNLQDLKKFGLWYKCIFSISSNDFTCTLWNNDAPSFVRVAQVLIPFGLLLGCLALLFTFIGCICRRIFVTIILFAALFAFLSFLFTTIGITVFATESLVYVDRLRLINNDNPRRWGMWLLIPNIVLSFLTSICFIIASILNWCEYRSMKVTGILSHSGDKYNGSVCKVPSDSNMTSMMKKQYQYQDYPNACYQINGLNNNQQHPIGYPPPPSYPGAMNPGFQTTPPGLFGYSTPGTPTMNQAYPKSNHQYDPYHSRHYMTENSEMDEMPRTNRSRHRSHSCRRSSRHSRSYSPHESTITTENNNHSRPNQVIPIHVPYYQPQSTSTLSQAITTQTQIPPTNNHNFQPVSYIMPQPKQQYVEDHNAKAANILKYGNGQQSVLVSNPMQPVYTIAYRANNGGNVVASNILTGPAAGTYVTATRNQLGDVNVFNSDSDNEDQNLSKRRSIKKINISEAWTWRKMR